MSGRFDGKPSTIGNTSKYAPAHDCREGSLKKCSENWKGELRCSTVLYAQSDAMPASQLLPDR